MKIVLPLLAIGAALTLAAFGSPAQAGNGPNR